MIITLDVDALNSMDLSSCSTPNEYFYALAGVDQYRLLCHISTHFNDSLIIDIGTANGDSALAFGYNKTNRIISFDITSWSRNATTPNCQYILGNYFDYMSDILTAKIILYDIPHSGTNFYTFCEMLRTKNYDGILILDDFTYDPVKTKDWNMLPDDVYVKIDVSKYGHFSGTGIVNFTKDVTFELK